MKRTIGRFFAFFLCVLCCTTAFFGVCLAGSHWDALWGDGSYETSMEYYRTLSHYRSELYLFIELKTRTDGEFMYGEQMQLEDLEDYFSPQNTNFRYTVRRQSGEVLFTNLQEGEIISEHTLYTTYGTTISGEHEEVYMECGSVKNPVVQDELVEARARYYRLTSALPTIAAITAVTALAGLSSLIALMVTAGRVKGREGIVLSWQDKIPTDLYAILAACLIALCGGGGASAAYTYGFAPYGKIGSGLPYLIMTVLGCLGCFLFAVAALLTLAVRIRSRSLFRNTLLARWGGWCVRKVKTALANLPMVWRVVVLFLLYLLGTVLTGVTIVFIPFYQGFVLFLLCRWVLQFRRVREGTSHIVSGELDYQIDHTKFYPDLEEHALQLNHLGDAMQKAVEERMKSERMKAELITNVSHDLKTPLTSIINYVDLLKKEDIQDEKAKEYIEVLDRKSQRLKKLTEDLVEASKASTGALAVSREPLDFCQLVRQGAGEYEEKLAEQSLTLVTDLPGGPLTVEADGRHLWRILDNLLGNCVKYAMPGTRVYLTLTHWDGNAVLSVKNVSRDPLNVPPDQLMERFVRGEESRTTEGSGLGLSIARSLTELQGGVFRLDIDGDFFKAIVRFPAETV